MNGVRRVAACLVASWVFLLATTVASAETKASQGAILWAVNNAQPFYILEGENQGQGFGDRIQQLIIEALPQYEHTIQRIPLRRVVRSMEHGSPLCFSTWIYGTRPDISISSAPYLHYHEHGLVMLSSTYERLGRPEQLSLNRLLQDSDLTLGQPQGRGYGTRLDPILDQYEQTAPIIRSSGPSTESIFKMLQFGRVFYTIEYPYTMRYYEQALNLQGQLVFVPIKENRGSIVLGAVACTRSEWGRRVIEDINRAIRSIRITESHRDILRDWLLYPESERSYWQFYDSNVLTVPQ